MAQAELKTKPTDAKVSAFVASVENPIRRSDAEQLLDIYAGVDRHGARHVGPVDHWLW